MGSNRRRINLYVSDDERAVIDALPPDVSRSELLRIGLAHYRAQATSCRHTRKVCRDCGSAIG